MLRYSPPGCVVEREPTFFPTHFLTFLPLGIHTLGLSQSCRSEESRQMPLFEELVRRTLAARERAEAAQKDSRRVRKLAHLLGEANGGKTLLAHCAWCGRLQVGEEWLELAADGEGGWTQVRIARELLGRCRSLSRSIAELERELQAQTTAIAPSLLELPGCAALTAAKLLCEIGPIQRFRSDAQLARHAGVAPLDASSGKHQRNRLDRGGNRQLNCALHRIAVTQGRVHGPAKAYLERKQNEGKSRREALRCLKRQLARTVYTTLKSEPLLT
jgi:transposase